jgi:hypothetical protein
MVHQINPGLARLYLESNIRQYGYQNPLVLAGLTEPQNRVLDLLELGISDNQLDRLPQLAKADPEQTRELLDRLGSALRRSSSYLPEFAQEQIDQRFSEILRLFAITDLDPAEALKRRKSSRVFVSQISRFGLQLCRGLAAAGIGTVLTEDQKRVSKFEIGPLGFPETALGQPRSQEAKSLLKEQLLLQSHSRVTNALNLVDVAVLVTTDVANPDSYQRWMARDIPHLLVTFTEEGVEVSHLVIPGITPCLGCLEVAKMAADSNWVSIATQLDYLERDLSDSTSLLFGVSLALGKTLARIDQLDQGSLVASKLDRKTMQPYQIEVADFNCGCR